MKKTEQQYKSKGDINVNGWNLQDPAEKKKTTQKETQLPQ